MQASNGGPVRGDAVDRGRPLVVTSDGELLDELIGLAGSGGVEVNVAVDALAAEAQWASAPLVVVGADQVDALARRNLPYRLGVIVVTRQAPPVIPVDPDSSADGATEPDPSIGEATDAGWFGVMALHAEHVVTLPDAGPWLVAQFADCRPRALRHAAPVVAFVDGSPSAGANLLATGVALIARRQGLATLLVNADPHGGPDPSDARLSANEVLAGAATDGTVPTGQPDDASLAVLSFDRRDGSAVPPDAMAAAMRAARYGRDLVVVDLPHAYDDAARLALTCADRAYLVVTAEIRECAAAARVAATVRRHCPRLELVVRAVSRRGLRPDEVAEAFDLPLVGVLPPRTAPTHAAPSVERWRAVAALCRRLLAQIGATRRPGTHRLVPPQARLAEEADR